MRAPAVLLAIATAAAAPSPALAQSSVPLGGYSVPRPQVQPPQGFAPCIDNASLQAVMGPCQGPVGQVIRVRLKGNLGAPAAILSFKAVVSRGAPARLQVRLQGSGLNYQTTAPPQLCIQGGGSWEAELVLANGRNLGVIGGYTPTNCPR
jgi:hypothetical protein